MNHFNRVLLQRIATSSLIALCLTVPAKATATVNVRAMWSEWFWGAYELASGDYLPVLPPGIALVCNNAVDQPDGCSAAARVQASNSAPKLRTLSAHSEGGFTISNATDVAYEIWFETDFSSFNPGGPEIGASVSYPDSEFALFSSSVSGPGISDAHSCDTRNYNSFETWIYFSPYACGVGSPDESFDYFSVTVEPGQSVTVTNTIAIDAQLMGAPEPLTLSLFGAGLAGLCIRRRNKSKARRPS